MTYPVAEIFHSIQGEGHFVGYPMTFIRLAGCSVLDCHIRAQCDTDYKMRERLTPAEIVERVRALRAPALGGHAESGIVSITGGEPSDHNLIPLVDALTSERYRIHIETSGKREITGLPIEWITVSPKEQHYRHRTGHVLKIVVTPQMTWETIRDLDQGTSFFHRYLQPLTVDGAAVNLPQVVEMITGSQNVAARWALSFQAHRTWGLR